MPGGRSGHDQVAELGARVPDLDLDLRRQREAHFGEDLARFADYPAAVLRRLVPGRRQTEHRPRVARAQRAHDDVVDPGRVLDRDQVLRLQAADPELGDRPRRVGAQPFAKRRVDPRPRDDACADHRPDLGFEVRNDALDGFRVDDALLGQHLLEGADPCGRVIGHGVASR